MESRSALWITGPPGAGKTTLIASYLFAREQENPVWYSIRPEDSDPATFFDALRKKILVQGRHELPSLSPEYHSGLPAFARHFFERFYQLLPTRFVLVLDDCHENPDTGFLPEVFRIAIEMLPIKSRIILISRDLPPASLARLQINQTLALLGWDDLALTETETGALLQYLTGQELPDEAVRILFDLTRGWMTGVVLLSKHQGWMEPKILPDDVREAKLLFDYFTEEIFQRMDATYQSLLLKCAFFRVMTAGMAARISGVGEAGHILALLNRQHYFIDIGENEKQYRIHNLFREFLLSRAAEIFSPSTLAELRHHAGKILEEEGQGESAAELYLDAGAWESLTHLLLTLAPGWIQRGSHRILSDWIGKIPAAYRTPWLDYWQGVAQLPFDPAQSRGWFETAFESFEPSGLLDGLYLSWCGVVETFFNQWDDFTGLDRWISWLDARLEKGAEFPSPEIAGRVVLGMFLALIFRKPDRPDLSEWIEQVMILSRNAPLIQQKVTLLFSMVFYLHWIGEFSRAKVLIEECKSSPDLPPLLALQGKLSEATNAWMTADFESACTAVREGIETGNAHGIHLWEHRLAAQGVYAALSGGNLDKAAPFLEKMVATLDPAKRLDVSHHHYLAAWNAFLQRECSVALEHVRVALDLAVDMGTPFPEALCRLGLAQIQIEVGEIDQARREVAQALDIGQGMKSFSLVFSAYLLESYACFKTGNVTQQGCHYLQQALMIGRKQGFVNFPFWESAMMTRLCAESLQAGIEMVYVVDLIRKRNLLPRGEMPLNDNWPWRYRIYMLGHFRLLRDGQPVGFPHKVQHKPLELLKLLATGGGRGISRCKAIDALWPDADGDKASHALESTLYRLKKILDPDAIEAEGDRLRLDNRYFWIDVVSFDHLLGNLRSLLDNGMTGSEALARLFDKLCGLYKGSFLEDAQEVWAQSEREHLTRKWCRHLEHLAIYWERLERWEAAADCYRRALEADPLIESFHLRLITVCEKTGCFAEAESIRRQIKSLFP